jgi:DNA-binding FadR family transcriptional regulator
VAGTGVFDDQMFWNWLDKPTEALTLNAVHVKLLEVASNRWAGQMVADLRKVIKLNRAQSLLNARRIEESLAEHIAIMAALTRRDVAAAQAAMRARIENG